ncbi:hypothetical protein TAMA11512_09200 [Selenomonas sp. TAMA-11512]|uniref:hypothetical protein n=1 Tax=Selenomonas sp. TAMA-11512 TaxID=3095337 RepID=UPI00308F5850|nr:hypothetical protein TAMA11512_09200 [Selenomonas sp. TAMA-11512]
MARYTIKTITGEKQKEELARALIRDLRAADRRELKASAAPNGSVEDEVHGSMLLSDELFAAYNEQGALIAVWGYRKFDNSPGVLIWCLGTDRIRSFRRAFAVESRRILRDWANRYGMLYNAVGAFNDAAISWLIFCGATFHEEMMIGGERFIPFTIEGEGGQYDVQCNGRAYRAGRLFSV